MHYVYLLRSRLEPNQTYIGYSTDLKQRLIDHNAGRSLHTKKYKPWVLVNYFAFSDMQKAKDFEHYLKTSSGKAFANKRLW